MERLWNQWIKRILIVESTNENGKIIILMDMESILVLIILLSNKVFGKMENCKEWLIIIHAAHTWIRFKLNKLGYEVEDGLDIKDTEDI